jgi:hypothetical protein
VPSVIPTPYSLFYQGYLYSQPSTWGGAGSSLPLAGQSIEVPLGTTLIVDTNTPALNLVNVDGALIFKDAPASTLKFEANYLISRAGTIIAGTATTPYQGNLVI